MLRTGETEFRDILSQRTHEYPRLSSDRQAHRTARAPLAQPSYTGAIVGVAIIIAWLGLWLFRQHDAVGLLLTSIATLLTLVAFRHLKELSEAQKQSLRRSLDQSDRRNRSSSA